MVRIYTVHGTNDGAPSASGEKWWQRGSEFQQKLAARIAEPLEFVPFSWSGANSEVARREAGAALSKKLQDEIEPPIVIGHSHGGSVTIHALLFAFLKSKEAALDRFRGIMTVGTPMIRYRSAWNPLFRFNIVGQLFLIYALLIGALVALTNLPGIAVGDVSDVIGRSVFSYFTELDADGGIWTFVARLFTPAVIFAVFFPILILWIFAARSSRRNRVFKRNALAQRLSEMYAPLNHRMDEAISALRGGVGLRLRIVDRKTVRGAIFAPISIVLALTFVLQTLSQTTNLEGIIQNLNFITGAAVEEEETGLAAPDIITAPEMPLALNETSQQLRYLAGDLRRNIEDDTTGWIRGGLTQQTTFLKSDYYVLDLATLLNAPDLWSVIDNIFSAEDTAVANLVTADNGECANVALYLTPDAKVTLELTAYALAEAGPDAMGALDPQEEDAIGRLLRRGGTGASEECPGQPYRTAPSAAAVAALLSDQVIASIIDQSLISVRPPSEPVVMMDGALVEMNMPQAPIYPSLRRGEAVIFERSAFNDANIACILTDLGRPIANATFWNPTLSDRWVGLNGLCNQLEGQQFTFYDFSTTMLDEVEYHLENGVTVIARTIGDLLPFGEEEPEAGSILEREGLRAGVLDPFYFVASVLVLAWILAWLGGLVLSPMLSGIFNATIRQQIYGNDGYGEEVVEVAPGLDFEQEMVGTLPQNVETDLEDYVRQYAPDTIERVRELVSLETVQKHGHLALTELSETLTWRELIHTSYFDVDSFVDHVADKLVETAGLTRVK